MSSSAGSVSGKKKGQIIWLLGYPASGKTFNADYLETLGWHNVDGDWLYRATKPEDIQLG
jgi:gluconate kinase